MADNITTTPSTEPQPKKPTRKRRAPTKNNSTSLTWEDIIDNQRSEMSWTDIFDMYRSELPHQQQGQAFNGTRSNSRYTPDPEAQELECRRCKVKFFSPHYFGGVPLCYLHRSNERDE